MRLRAITAWAIIATLLGTGCASDEPETPPVEPAAEALSEAIATGDFSNVKTTGGDATTESATILEGMHGMRPQVKVTDITPYENAATVKLETTWPLSSPWTYPTEATMQLVEGEWNVMWDPAILAPGLDENNRLERTTENATRGNIVGAGGFSLTATTPAHFVGIDASQAGPEAEKTARTVADTLSVDADGVVKEMKDRPGEIVIIGAARTEEISEVTELPGVVTNPIVVPLAPPTSTAQALVGRLGTASADQAVTSAGRITPGSVVGRSGLQSSREEHLRGIGATKVYLVPRAQAIGQVDPSLNELVADYPESPGKDVTTTVNTSVQEAVDETLSSFEEPTSIVAIKPKTGEILAVGDTKGTARANADSLNASFSPEAAGSPIAALALMRGGVNLESDEVKCEDKVDVEGRAISESQLSRASTNTTLEQAMGYGCVTAAASQHGRTDAKGIQDAAASLGVGVDHDLGVPTDFGDFEIGAGAGDVAEALAGRGSGMQVSPLGMASMAASVASGTTVVPWAVGDAKPKPEGQPPLTPAEAAALRKVMETGASGVASSVSSVDGALMGTSDNRAWVVGYSDDVAFAVVTHAESPSTSTLATAASAITSAAANTNDGEESDSGEESGSGEN